MVDVLQQKLKNIIDEHGYSVCRDIDQCISLLKNYRNKYEVEIKALLEVIERNPIPGLFYNFYRSTYEQDINYEDYADFQTNSIIEKVKLPREKIKLAIDSWAIALGIVIPTAQGLQYSINNIKIDLNRNFEEGDSVRQSNSTIINYKNGERYKGETKNGKRQGKGTYYYENGDRYEGNWINGESIGFGKLLYADGSTYEGGIIFGKGFGHGIYISSTGVIIECDWVNGSLSGNGVVKDADGTVRYEGGLLLNKRFWDGTYYYPNGDKYIGSWLFNKCEGHGLLTWHDGGSYEGDFKEGEITGQGVRVYPNGDKYEGWYKSGLRNGYGVYYYVDGDIHKGEWKDNTRTGCGEYISSDGDRYEGCYLAGLYHGYGEYFYSNGDKYEGEWRNGTRSGYGVYHYHSDAGDSKDGIYEGEWLDGLRHGYGIYVYADGRKYQGDWVDNQMDGFGVFTYRKGISYEGEFKCGKFHGFGKYTYENGDIYEGEWQDDMKIGFGMLLCSDERYYEGEFQHGRLHGHGLLKWDKGIYQGQWKQGFMEGNGTYHYSNGNAYDGEWHNDKRSGEGTLLLKDGSKYIGEWSKDKINGYGTFLCNNGNKYEGEWKDNRLHGSGVVTLSDEYVYQGMFVNGRVCHDNNKHSNNHINEDEINKVLKSITESVSNDIVTVNEKTKLDEINVKEDIDNKETIDAPDVINSSKIIDDAERSAEQYKVYNISDDEINKFYRCEVELTEEQKYEYSQIADEFISLFFANLDSLKTASRYIEMVKLRYSFNEDRNISLQTIGDRFGISREGVRQIIVKVFRRLASLYKRNSNSELNRIKVILNNLAKPGTDEFNKRVALFLFYGFHATYVKTITKLLTDVFFGSGYEEVIQRTYSVYASNLDKKLEKERKDQTNTRLFNSRILNKILWPRSTNIILEPQYRKIQSVRQINSENGSLAGKYYSNKLMKSVQYESLLEKEVLLILENCEKVIFYEVQPFGISYTYKKDRTYVPDIFFVMDDGRGVVVEIKPAFHMAYELNLEKYHALKSYCGEKGLGMLITDGRTSIEDLILHNYDKNFEQELLQKLSQGPVKWKDFSYLKDKYNIKYNDLASVVINNNLYYSNPPFIIMQR